MNKQDVLDYVSNTPCNTNVNVLTSMLDRLMASDNLDTSDATATVADILQGKTAYANGNKIEGTITLKEAETIVPTTSDKTIAAKQYLKGAQTIKGDSNLIEGNIKSGVSIFGVTGNYNGLNTADANAVEGDLLAGKTAYVNGKKITGTAPAKEASTITPTTSDQTVAAGTHLTGLLTIKGDPNLIAANIKKGVTIFGIEGTYTGDANATAADIATGKTAYVNGQKITGTATIQPAP